MLEAIWARLVDEHNSRAQGLKCNSSTAVMSLRASIGIPTFGMMLKNEGYLAPATAQAEGGGFGLKESVHAYATAMRKELSLALKGKVRPGVVNGRGGGEENNSGRKRKQRGRGKVAGRTKGFCFQFNNSE